MVFLATGTICREGTHNPVMTVLAEKPISCAKSFSEANQIAPDPSVILMRQEMELKRRFYHSKPCLKTPAAVAVAVTVAVAVAVEMSNGIEELCFTKINYFSLSNMVPMFFNK